MLVIKQELNKTSLPRGFVSLCQMNYYHKDVGVNHPIRVLEQGNYHGIVYHEYSGVQLPIISMLFIP